MVGIAHWTLLRCAVARGSVLTDRIEAIRHPNELKRISDEAGGVPDFLMGYCLGRAEIAWMDGMADVAER